jgi:tetratricopeptide (TPR) repeat protein
MSRNEEAFEAAQESVRILRACGLHREALVSLMIQGDVLGGKIDVEGSEAIYLEVHELAQSYGDARMTARSRLSLGSNALRKGDADRSREVITVAYTEMRNAGNLWEMGLALGMLGLLAFLRGDYDEATQIYQEMFSNAQKSNHPSAIGSSLANLARVAWKRGDLPEARRLYEDSLKIAQHIGLISAYVLISLGSIANEMGDAADAKSYFRQAFKAGKQTGEIDHLLILALVMAECMAPAGMKENAVELLSVYQQHPQRSVMQVILIDTQRPDRLIEQLKTEMSPEAFTAAWAEGQKMTLEQALTHALAGDS